MTGGPGEVHAAQSLKQNLEVPFGWFPQPVYFATIMRRHMIEFGTTEEQFGAVALACRRHANLHPGAVMHGRPMDIDSYLASAMLADPLRLFDSCLISDGGAAFVQRERHFGQAGEPDRPQQRGIVAPRDGEGGRPRPCAHGDPFSGRRLGAGVRHLRHHQDRLAILRQ